MSQEKANITKTTILVILLVVAGAPLMGQEVQTLFRGSSPSGGYGAISNKFTHIAGQYANVAEVYGGWFIKRKFLLGVGAAASTNNISVPKQFSTAPLTNMSWQYGQFGLVTEYVFWSNRVVHFNVSLFNGGGFTVQYERERWDHWDDNYDDDLEHDENFFYVMEPGVQLEVNVLKWLRLSPGISYRKTFGSDGIGLDDDALSDWSYNIALKIGRF